MIFGSAYLFLYDKYCSFEKPTDCSASNMTQNQTEQTISSARVTGILVSTSLAIVMLLFLYIMYNVIVNAAGAAILLLLLIALAFSFALLKTIKLMDKLAFSPPTGTDVEQSRISTVENLTHQMRARHDSLPPTYEEATKNSLYKLPTTTDSVSGSLPTYSTVIDCSQCAKHVPSANTAPGARSV